jgi:hypothetical protein
VSRIARRAGASLLALALAASGASAPRAQDGGDAQPAAAPDGRYQIVEAGPNRVWRLDTHTGVVSVCTLEGDRLVCTTSSEAARPPKQSYEELQAERQQRAQAETEEKLAILDRMIGMFRDLVGMLIRMEGGTPPADGDGQQAGGGA